MANGPLRPTWLEVDLSAIQHNVSVLCDAVAPAKLAAVVKAFGYGHGSIAVSQAALAGGAEWLAVALVEEGLELREAGIKAPILVLSEPPVSAMSEVVASRLTPAVYTTAGIEAAARAVSAGESPPLPVHLKVDTGMHRVGAQPHEVVGLAESIARQPGLSFEGLWTHLAVADELAHPFNEEQLRRFDKVVTAVHEHGLQAEMLHAANSAAAISLAGSRFDLVRCGIAVYGIAPSMALQEVLDLQPAASLKSRVAHVKTIDSGERVSYGLRYEVSSPSVIATVPIGYADGVPRNLGLKGAHVLINGIERPIVGTVTMDQLMVDCGDDHRVAVGDEVVLIGTQGEHHIDVWDWAQRLDTIGYEVICGISVRVPRRYIESDSVL